MVPAGSASITPPLVFPSYSPDSHCYASERRYNLYDNSTGTSPCNRPNRDDSTALRERCTMMSMLSMAIVDPYYRQDPYADYEDHRRTTCYDSREDGYAHPRCVQRRSDSDLGGNLRRPFPHGIRTPNASPGHKGQYEPQSSRPEPSRTTIVTKASGEGDDDIPSHILRQVPECEGYELSYSEQTRESTAYVFEKNRDQPGREQGFAVVVNTK
ncbi:hypothetical protein L486_01985 [Kwoniella mangroviensis CBS 10435]|uniref:Uncharacterized protein n=1 Tax=Kwoniella mangroviensis CBS 10435 TaxID=1331196 RepID=A0A1B9J3F4_9TREE|nr:hypothetical protein L486_01985 [Kwoniella mangroviensis CBS 10435]